MANWFGSALRAAGDVASNVGDNIRETTSNVTTAASKTVGSLSQEISETAARMVDTVQGWLPFSNQDTLGFFAVLFAVAAADKNIDEAEMSLILASPEASKLSTDERETLQSYSYNPPALKESIRELSGASPELKFGLIFCILNLVQINGEMTSAEQDAIQVAQEAFEINDVQLEAIENFMAVLDRNRDAQTAAAIADVKAATERMTRVGIPVKALAYSQEDTADDIEYSDEKFIEKMRGFGVKAGRGLVEQAFVMWNALHSPATPVSAKLTIAGALAYWILPVDILPDILPAVGFTDDFTTIASAMTRITLNITPEIRAKAKQQTNALFAGETVLVTAGTKLNEA